jgi:selenide,water dikinase
MQRNSSALVEVLADHGCQACTDVTGFGLLGHLGEMLGGGTRVLLESGSIKAHAGALDLLAEGYASTLAPAKAASLALLDADGPVQLQGAPGCALLQQLLIDPQTCGPLLGALPAAAGPAALAALHGAGFSEAALIGRVVAA